jgi:DNA repair exonuclease SbcCD ATPase subunit
MINILKTNVEKFTHALQIADIHIRLTKRHDEYKEVFANLYEEIKKTPTSTVVVLVGDVFHSKSDLTPECVEMATNLFKNIADLRPLVLVAGNHDATLSNKSRLDSLTPLVDSLNHPNLFYLKTTGLYGMSNILWNNMGVFDAPEHYIRGETIPAVYRNQYEHVIALFHGAMDRAAMETGYSIQNPNLMPPLFDHNDIAMLGDIHMLQDMQDYDEAAHKPCIHYCGSMIQQNHGEGLAGHGYSLWDLKTRKYEHHPIKNDFGYFTVDVQKGQLTTSLDKLPKRVRLRMKCYESIASEVKKVLAEIKMKTQVVETAYVRMDQERDKKDIIPLCKDIVLADLTSVEYQEKLLMEFLTKKLDITEPTKIDSILQINRNTNQLIKRDEFSRNLKWKPIRFEWDNMFTYGEGNVIDFTQMSGVYGIFGPNRCGKSSILSSIIFCLFDKFDRGYKGLHVRNVQKETFRCKMEFEISGVRYFIERRGNTTRSGNVKVDVRFWKVVNGVEEDLQGTARRDTNDIIRDYIGSYEDFIITAASFQTAKNLTSFIDMGNSERKDMLVQFIGLNVFDRLDESARERSRELGTILKTHKDKNYQLEIEQNKNALAHAETLFAAAQEQADSLKTQITEVNEAIIAESANLIKLDTSVPTDLPTLETRRETAEKTIKAKHQTITETREANAEREKQLATVDSEISTLEKQDLVESHKKHKEISDKISAMKQKVELKKVEVKGKLEKVDRLKTHKFDPNCKFCVDNQFVKDAYKAKEELKADKKETDGLMQGLDDLNKQLESYRWVETAYEKYTRFLTYRGNLREEIQKGSKQIIIITNELERLDAAYKEVLSKIDIYHRNEVAVENNAKVQSKVNAFKVTLGKLDVALQKQNQVLMDISGKKELFRSTVETVTKTLNEVTAMEDELDSYVQYLAAVGRDGIPYQVICNTVPEIEKEVNSILSQVTDYTIQFDTDGKNIVPYVVYEHGRWPIELTSGFERFVASVAIRVALTNISNLPKTTFLALDEGFGTLDPDNLASMFSLFHFLKNNFDFVLVISHLDALKDAVDKQIEIRKEGNFSFVNYE